MCDGAYDAGGGPDSLRGEESGGSLSVRRLREIEALLGVVIDPAGLAHPPAGPEGDREIERQAIELVRAFNRITDPEARRRVLHLVREAARADRT